MEVIAPNRDIIFSDASGKRTKADRSSKRTERKESRSAKRTERKEVRSTKRVERKEAKEIKGGGLLKRLFNKLKAKKNARKLKRTVNKKNEKVWVDEVPPVTNNQKQLTDGTKVEVPIVDQTKVGNVIVDKKDLKEATNITERDGKVIAEIPEQKVVIQVNEQTGQEEAYKESDIESDGMSKTAWITIGITGLVLAGTVAYFLTRKKS